jgi:rod shape-determining protein MreC
MLQEAQHENQYLTRMLKFDDRNNRYDFLTARVIANDPNLLGQYIVINRGSRDGLKPGMTVVSQDSYFAGSIVSVLPTAAKVELMLSPSSTVGAYDMQTRAQAVVIGQFDGMPELRNVPTSAKLRVGDFVLTSGQANIFPRGLLLGQITAVHRRNEDLFQTADLQPATDFQNMELVQVIRNQPAVPIQLLQGP